MATFDLISVDGAMESIDNVIKAKDDAELVFEHFKQFEYSSTNPIYNLKIIFFAMIALLLIPIVVKGLELAFYCDNTMRYIQRFKEKKLYWNLYLRFFLETFLELAISGFVRVKVFRITNVTETLLTMFAVLLLLILVSYMIGSKVFLNRKFDIIKTQSFKDRYGALTLGLYHRDRSAMYYPSVFMLRRFLLAALFVLLVNSNYA